MYRDNRQYRRQPVTRRDLAVADQFEVHLPRIGGNAGRHERIHRRLEFQQYQQVEPAIGFRILTAEPYPPRRVAPTLGEAIVDILIRHAFQSTAGAPSRRQREQIGLAARTLPNVRTVVLAQDHDEAGERQAEALRRQLEVPSQVAFQRRRPPEHADWNDVICAAATG